jgi:hypothetical protein
VGPESAVQHHEWVAPRNLFLRSLQLLGCTGGKQWLPHWQAVVVGNGRGHVLMRVFVRGMYRRSLQKETMKWNEMRAFSDFHGDEEAVKSAPNMGENARRVTV